MKNSTCLFNSAIALRRVFIHNAFASDATTAQQQARRLFVPSLNQRQQRQPRCTSRPFSTHPTLLLRYKKPEPVVQSRLPRNREITEQYIHLIQDGKLSQPLRTRDVLRDIDENVEAVQVVAMPNPKQQSEASIEEQLAGHNRGHPEWPICKIVNLGKERLEEREKMKQLRKKSVESKELEINWGISKNDLEVTKLRQFRKFLAKGMTVQITLLDKGRLKRQGKKNVASPDEAKAIMKTIQDAVASVPGSTQIKAEGVVGKQMLLTFKGPVGGVKEPAAPAADAVAA